jgi:hypothetical protein
MEGSSKDRTYLRKRLTQQRKSIHLSLEGKTFFDNSTPAMPQYGIQHSEVIDIAGREKKKHAQQKVTKQSLSDYAQQD